ncbi:MAG: sugar ABC transporter ATP-binding protein [Clostridiales bacterium]|nr:sugar ABC transporter ATP-binding protein [Clostridiales bacterium]
MQGETILEMRGIVKQYPGVTALKGVDFSARRNAVHCLVGENGAGKSTLIKILTCVERMTEGSIVFDGRPFLGRTVRDAMNAGISTVYQELNIVNQLTVAENLTLGREKNRLGVLKKTTSCGAFDMLREFAPDIALSRRVSMLSFAEKQLLEIVKAVSADAKLVIMDEPTAALSRRESERLYDAVRKLKARGIAVIYISHVLDDIFTIGDEVTALRDGSVVGTRDVPKTTREELVEMMVGKVVHSKYAGGRRPSEALLEARELSTKSVRALNFRVRKGEIFGFYGLRGAGKSETARAVMGLDRLTGGQLLLEGKPASIRSPGQAMRLGIAMVPEERLTEGLFMKLSVSDNIAVTNYKDASRFCIVRERHKAAVAEKFVRDLNIKVHSVRQRASTLSGGNQQKVVISKCLNARTELLMLDEPSRGIDVGAKEEIYAIIRSLAARGVGILVFSSEYEEIAALCDRVALMVDGKIAAILKNDELNIRDVHMLIMGKGDVE